MLLCNLTFHSFLYHYFVSHGIKCYVVVYITLEMCFIRRRWERERKYVKNEKKRLLKEFMFSRPFTQAVLFQMTTVFLMLAADVPRVTVAATSHRQHQKHRSMFNWGRHFGIACLRRFLRGATLQGTGGLRQERADKFSKG